MSRVLSVPPGNVRRAGLRHRGEEGGGDGEHAHRRRPRGGRGPHRRCTTGSSQEGAAQASGEATPAGARIGTDWAASDEPDGSPRQAVVLIHGIGDQPPMRSLRSFTVGIGLPRLFSSPDRVTDSTELRRLSEPPTPHRRAHTDFFELYWAHLAPDADLRTSLSWGVQLLLSRRWWSVGGAAARLVIAFQIAMAALVALLLWGLVDAIVSGGLPGLRELVATWQVWLALALAVGGGSWAGSCAPISRTPSAISHPGPRTSSRAAASARRV